MSVRAETVDDQKAQDPDNEAQSLSDFERKKWETDVNLRRLEFGLKAREQRRLATEAARSRRWNPLVIAIVGATITAAGSIVVSLYNGISSEQTERIKAESARIIEMIHGNDIQIVRRNLKFLVESGLITGSTKEDLQGYLKRTPIEEGPLLPSSSWSQPATPVTEASEISKFGCPGNAIQYWIYHYTARRAGEPAFSVILPPNWGQPIGGHDLSTREEAENVASTACKSNSKIFTRDGMIIAPQNLGGTTYVIENGTKRAIPDIPTFESLGFTWDKLVRLPDDQLNAIPTGSPIPRASAQPNVPR